MRLSPSLFRPLLRSLASDADMYKHGPIWMCTLCTYTLHTSIPFFRIQPRRDPALSNSWLIYIDKQKVQLTTFHYSEMCVSDSDRENN